MNNIFDELWEAICASGNIFNYKMSEIYNDALPCSLGNGNFCIAVNEGNGEYRVHMILQSPLTIKKWLLVYEHFENLGARRIIASGFTKEMDKFIDFFHFYKDGEKMCLDIPCKRWYDLQEVNKRS